MYEYLLTFIGILIPFVGTLLGATTVFLFKKEMGPKLLKSLIGFAAGVMIAASIWSLILPAIDMSSSLNRLAFIPSSVGFIIGMVSMLLLDKVIKKIENDETKKHKRSKLGKSFMLFLAVTLHNIPEGMAVGVIFAGMLSNSEAVTIAGAFALSMGIAIQNFPEGAIVSVPLVSNNISKKKAFEYGVISGVVEPISAVITLLLTTLIEPILPYILSFAAGTMIYVVIEELIPELHEGEHSVFSTLGVAFGFSIMMMLDVAFG